MLTTLWLLFQTSRSTATRNWARVLLSTFLPVRAARLRLTELL